MAFLWFDDRGVKPPAKRRTSSLAGDLHRLRSIVRLRLSGSNVVSELDSDGNILTACGGSWTHLLFRTYRAYVQKIMTADDRGSVIVNMKE